MAVRSSIVVVLLSDSFSSSFMTRTEDEDAEVVFCVVDFVVAGLAAEFLRFLFVLEEDDEVLVACWFFDCDDDEERFVMFGEVVRREK